MVVTDADLSQKAVAFQGMCTVWSNTVGRHNRHYPATQRKKPVPGKVRKWAATAIQWS